jgi:hypothetical protein
LEKSAVVLNSKHYITKFVASLQKLSAVSQPADSEPRYPGPGEAGLNTSRWGNFDSAIAADDPRGFFWIMTPPGGELSSKSENGKPGMTTRKDHACTCKLAVRPEGGQPKRR